MGESILGSLPLAEKEAVEELECMRMMQFAEHMGSI